MYVYCTYMCVYIYTQIETFIFVNTYIYTENLCDFLAIYS